MHDFYEMAPLVFFLRYILLQAGYCVERDTTENDGIPITGKWTAGGVTWQDTYQEHVRQVMGARPAFDWHREGAEDWIYPGASD